MCKEKETEREKARQKMAKKLTHLHFPDLKKAGRPELKVDETRGREGMCERAEGEDSTRPKGVAQPETQEERENWELPSSLTRSGTKKGKPALETRRKNILERQQRTAEPRWKADALEVKSVCDRTLGQNTASDALERVVSNRA
ncbi:hypothetical protein NDU88_003691 [Pleurodeles waltl]|uniref:Uncharacterized protein n=1 Tax=Pleurodeles waltl TaxID=8319 RepID=A0AAV7QG58_PLEWA|nr:hypothetical protein NDU88_003691 [Pleurodeles waltl]